MDRMNRMEGQMMNDECGMMNQNRAVFHSSFIIHHFFLILPILSIPVNFVS
jgi:hypothetical protein